MAEEKDTKDLILDYVKSHPYTPEKILKQNLDTSEQNIATQLRQLMDDQVIGRQKSGGVYKYYVMDETSVEEPSMEDEVEEEMEAPIEESPTDIIHKIVSALPSSREEIIESTTLSEENVDKVLDGLLKSELIIEDEGMYLVNNMFFSLDESAEEKFDGETITEEMDEEETLRNKILRNRKMEDRDVFEYIKEIKEKADNFLEMAVWNELLDIIEKHSDLTEKELVAKAKELAIQNAKDRGVTDEDDLAAIRGMNPQTLAIQLRRLVNEGKVSRHKDGRYFRYQINTGDAPIKPVARGSILKDIMRQIEKGFDSERKLLVVPALEHYSPHTIFAGIGKLIRSKQLKKVGGKLEIVGEEASVEEQKEESFKESADETLDGFSSRAAAQQAGKDYEKRRPHFHMSEPEKDDDGTWFVDLYEE